MDFNFKNLPPQKKRVLAIGGIAFVVLLFLSFLLSLSEDNNSQQQQQQQQQQQANQEQKQNQDLKLPSSQRYDFEQNKNQGLENLLNNEQALGPAPIPTQDEDVHEEILRAPEKKSYFLHCNSFANEQDAEQGKAMLAFQGVMATVESYEGKYRLRIGPFDSRESAQKMFNEQSNKGLLNECRLIGK